MLLSTLLLRKSAKIFRASRGSQEDDLSPPHSPNPSSVPVFFGISSSMVIKTPRVSKRARDKWTLSNVCSKRKSAASSRSIFASSRASECTMSKAQQPTSKTTKSKYNRKSSLPAHFGQSGVDAQAKRSSTGAPYQFHFFGQSMEHVQPKRGSSSSGAAEIHRK